MVCSEYPPRSPAEWLAEGGLNGDHMRMVDVRLDTLPQDQPWSRIGPNLLCTEGVAPGAVNIQARPRRAVLPELERLRSSPQ
jgi:hypothetical protein